MGGGGGGGGGGLHGRMGKGSCLMRFALLNPQGKSTRKGHDSKTSEGSGVPQPREWHFWVGHEVE